MALAEFSPATSDDDSPHRHMQRQEPDVGLPTAIREHEPKKLSMTGLACR